MRLHIHSPGRSGPRAWPSAPGDARFIALRADEPARDAASELAKVGLDDSTEAVFAHSYLAIPAALAVRESSVALVLVEPAFYDIARGHRDIESHISTIEHARLQLAAGDLWGYWTAIRPLMFGGPAQEVTWEEERAAAAEFARRTLPWGHGLRAEHLNAPRILVVTGGWNDEYEAIAGRLVDAGASHVVLPGHGHRAQDHPRFAEVASAFLDR
ncbi:alpha/beta hydrolase [Microbacterium nymphoidis]|uniref:alpha/beta hydrolase n=1 Tax=Microbacterium nymphoidis TaxID=2898586 RepID=UPI001E4B4AAD|nr:alpha/beta hydrolase [Microbacterium nymphoidis]MCD2497438.1 alpha/beta hydrolase [Microbacterium nymphoidis]